MHVATTMAVVMAMLTPTRTWYAPNQPWEIVVKSSSPVMLMVTDFTGKPVNGPGAGIVKPGEMVNLKTFWPAIANPGTYVVWPMPVKAANVNQFLGTPLVVSVREDKRRNANPGPMVAKIETLKYMEMETEAGTLTMAFYYDVAPHTVANFLTLAEGKYFDGLTFHRIVPGFVIQGGDPRGDGTGGPGYHIEAEFNDRQHVEGVLSMARNGDPNEGEGQMPRPEYANTAGSQFFVCLDYEKTKFLDGKYTAFGKVMEGMEAVKSIASTPADAKDRPTSPQIIKSARVLEVTPEHNPYKELIKVDAAAIPTTEPVLKTTPTK